MTLANTTKIINVKCPQCHESILKTADNSQVLRGSSVILFNPGGTFAKCKKCKTEVLIPVRIVA